MAATTILLVRHGETDWNRDRRVQGHTDVPLNDVGRSQAETLAAALESQPFSAVYASDLTRALGTARILAAARSLPVTPDPALREKHFGTWEGLTDVEVLARFPDAQGGAWGDGETTAEMAARVLAGLRAIAAAHPCETVLVVTHGGPMRAALRDCGAEDGPIENCRLVALVSDEGVLRPRD